MKIAEWWLHSGLANEAARDLMWFVVFVIIGIGVTIWRDMK